MRRSHAIFVLVFLAFVVVPGAASAAQWTAANESCGGMDPERGSGQMDAAGRLYMACSRHNGVHYNHIGIFDPTGAKIRVVPLDFGDGATNRAGDVAPSPDGQYIYVVRYDNRTTYRFDRQADGGYKINPAWGGLQKFPALGGGDRVFNPRGQFIATDATGDIYFSSGLWSVGTDGTEDAIVKYHADGSFVTRFGRKSGGSWALGDSHGSFGGLAVTANGARVFVTDINNSRVQRFDRQGDGSYRAVLAMGMNQTNDPNRWGGCFGDGWLAAPYDLSLSAGGELLVMSTTCYNETDPATGKAKWAGFPIGTVEVQRFSQNGDVRGSITAQSVAQKRVHGIGVDRSGNIHLPQGGIVVRPAAGWSDFGADAGGGGPLGGTAAVVGGGPVGPIPGAPDDTAPVLASATGPATTTVANVSIALGATDDTGVTQVRVREDGTQYAWRAYAATIEHTLSDKLGAHQLVVQVRDAAGNVSGERALTITRNAATPTPAAPAPTNPKPAQPTGPTTTKPTTPKPASPGDADGEPKGDVTKPVISRVKMPAQVTRGRAIKITIAATDDVAVTQVRFSTAGGRWGAWQPVKGTRTALLPAGTGWRPVFTQVQDAAGNRSRVWYQAVLLGPSGTSWFKGTMGVDSKRFGAGAQHVDVGSFDGKVDQISCGRGIDSVLAQADDVVAADCEHVTRVRMPAW